MQAPESILRFGGIINNAVPAIACVRYRTWYYYEYPVLDLVLLCPTMNSAYIVLASTGKGILSWGYSHGSVTMPKRAQYAWFGQYCDSGRRRSNCLSSS
eukprot:COSAG02_NODE_6969_length_3258_cov_5.714924_2_plen_99_part_00